MLLVFEPPHVVKAYLNLGCAIRIYEIRASFPSIIRARRMDIGASPHETNIAVIHETIKRFLMRYAYGLSRANDEDASAKLPV